jgi:DNA mismatch endonuclease (patch repair protein)
MGRPDIVFVRQQVAIFCDGDFWHGRSWGKRKAHLSRGSNPGYWIAKIERNIYRDGQVDEALRGQGWRVIRFWESDIRKSPDAVAGEILDAMRD